MDVDQALLHIGEYGKLQRHVLWSLAVPQMFVAWHHIQNAFTGAEPQVICVRAGQESVDGCPKPGEQACDSHIFTGKDFTSIASEWNLVCQNGYKSDLVQSMFMAGLLVGNFVGGAIADQYGRRRLVYISSLGITVLSILAALAHSFEGYILWRFLAAVSTGAYGLVSFTLPAELVGAEQRGFVNVLTTVMYALGVGTLSCLAYLIRDWRVLSCVTALPFLIGIYYYRSVPESPRWLYSQGRLEEAEAVLSHIAHINSGGGGHVSAHPIKLQPLPSVSFTSQGQRTSAGGRIMDLVRHPLLRRVTVNNIYTWFVIAAVYYGLTLRAGTLGSNRYVSVSLAGLVEIPADFLTLWTMDRFGRRATYSWSLFAGGFCCIAIVTLPEDLSTVATMLAFLGKIGISMAYCVCWIHAAEMYPTNIRNKALSVCNMSSRLGGIASPLILTLGKVHDHMDFMIFGTSTVLAGIVSRALPETLNRPMPETLGDLDLCRSSVGRSTEVLELPVVSMDMYETKVRLLEGEIGELQRKRECID